MTFTKFNEWCNDRACDGCWSMNTAIICINIIDKYNKIWFKWRREQVWNKSDEKILAEQIVKDINKKIKDYNIKQSNKPIPYTDSNHLLGKSATFYKCPKCGSELLYMNNSEYCGKCGLELDWSDII